MRKAHVDKNQRLSRWGNTAANTKKELCMWWAVLIFWGAATNKFNLVKLWSDSVGTIHGKGNSSNV